MKKRNYFYYWANNSNNESGEGLLCKNFINLLKKRYPEYMFVNLNNFRFRESFFYNYCIPFIGVFKLWYFNLRGFKISYINYLPIWNFFLFLFLPQNTVLGPITGTSTKKNILYFIFKKISFIILKNKWKRFLFSNDQFKKDLEGLNKKKFYNFLFYNFKTNIKKNKKIYDIIFYYRKNSNKGNSVYISLLNKLSKNYKIAVIGDTLNSNKNIKNFKWVKRKTAINIIAQSKFGILSKENIFSYFALDCLSNSVPVFYNSNLSISNKLKNKNFLIPLKYFNERNSLLVIKNKIEKKKIMRQIKFKKFNFDKYLI